LAAVARVITVIRKKIVVVRMLVVCLLIASSRKGFYGEKPEKLFYCRLKIVRQKSSDF
jgi:hypothetical protein